MQPPASPLQTHIDISNTITNTNNNNNIQQHSPSLMPSPPNNNNFNFSSPMSVDGDMFTGNNYIRMNDSQDSSGMSFYPSYNDDNMFTS